MSTPAVSTRPVRCRAHRERVCRPDWSAVPEGSGSNTSGAGDALRPSVRIREYGGRSIRNRERAFDEANWWWRTRRRTAMVLQSPGVVLLGGLGCLLMIGLSPLLAAPEPADPPPVTPVVDSVTTGGVTGAADGGPGTVQPDL